MNLILSSRHPRNSTYTHSETGQILYKVDKPLLGRLRPGTATIRKAVGTVKGVWKGEPSSSSGTTRSPARQISGVSERSKCGSSDVEGGGSGKDSHDRRRRSSVDETFVDSDDERGEGEEAVDEIPVLEGHFAFYAQIEFKTFSSTRFRFDSEDVSVSEYFRKEGWNWYGRGRVFKARDGKEYRWELRVYSLVMVTNDTNEAELVRYHPYCLGLGPLAKSRAAYLKIDSTCPEEIMDEVIMTFIYCHKLKKDRERAGSNGPGYWLMTDQW